MLAERYRDTEFGSARRTIGRHGYIAYYPRPIPRQLTVSPAQLLLVSDADAALGRLSGAGRLLPDPHLLIRPYLYREAIASTRIEGTQASLLEVYDAEASDRPPGADVEEVVNYVRALEAGLLRLGSLPLSTRLLRDMHAVLLAGVRGRERQPGQLRTTQNWVGPVGATIETAVFVPPPPDELPSLLTDLERFIHEKPLLPPLVQAAALHYQFETIHPFLDGNGRLGRLLIVLFLIVRERLSTPLLYLSSFLESRRDQYYAALQGVREGGDFDNWLSLFLDAVTNQAIDAVLRAERLMDLREQYRQRVRAATRGAANQLVDYAFEQPVLTSKVAESRLHVSRPVALRALRDLEAAGVVVAMSVGPRGQQRWLARDVLTVLSE